VEGVCNLCGLAPGTSYDATVACPQARNLTCNLIGTRTGDN
jgi:hypothetical protein